MFLRFFRVFVRLTPESESEVDSERFPTGSEHLSGRVPAVRTENRLGLRFGVSDGISSETKVNGFLCYFISLFHFNFISVFVVKRDKFECETKNF